MTIPRPWKRHPLRTWLVASATAALVLQALAAIAAAEHFYPTYGSSWDHPCDDTQESQCVSWHFAARSYEYLSLETYMVTATNAAISQVYNPTDIFYYSDPGNGDTGYFDADYGTAGGIWAWTSCSPGASKVGLDSTHNRDCVPDDVRYNLHYLSSYNSATRQKALACHETGHIFGLLHNTSTSSCMHNTPGIATTLIQGEKDLLNANY